MARSNPQSLVVQPNGMGEIRINRRCNERCLFCNSEKAMDHFLEDPAEVLAGIDELRARGCLGLTISGLEPTLDRELPRYIRHARAQGFERVFLQSNGVRLARRERAEELAAAGVSAVTLSLHAIDPAVGERLTGYAHDVRDSLAAIDHLMALGIPVEVNHVVTRLNLDQGPPLVQALAARCNTTENEPARRAFFAELEVSARILWEPQRTRELIEREIGWPPPTELDQTLPPYKLIVSFIAPSFGNVVRRERLIPRYEEAVPHIQATLARAADEGVPATLASRCGIPFCLMDSGHRHIPVYAAQGQVSVPSTHIKYPFCNDCPLSSWCEGVWRGYVELHGMAEIIRGARRMSRRRASKKKTPEPAP